MSFKRKLSSNERMYISFEKNYNSFMINRVVEGKGYIDLKKLQKAVSKVAYHMPESRFVLKGNYWIDSEIPPKVVEVSKKIFDNNFKELMKNKIDIFNEPCCEVYLYSDENKEKTIVVFRTHHGVMDGKGQSIWIENIFKELNELRVNEFESKIRDIDVLERNGIKKKSDIVSVGKYSPIENRLSFEITTPISKKLVIDKSIKNITAKLMSNIHKLSSDEKSRFIITKDIREKFMSETKNSGNFSLPIYLDITDNDWKLSNQSLINMILNDEDIKYSPVEYAIFEKIPMDILKFSLNRTITRYNNKEKSAATAVISNLGKIDVRDYTTDTFIAESIYALPVITPLVPISFIVTEVENKTIITMGYYEDNFDNSQVDEYLLKLKQLLLNEERVRIEGDKKIQKINILEQIFMRKESSDILSISGNEKDTYKEIFTKVRILSSYLKSIGIKKGDKVAISQERDKNYLVSILACLKLGAIFIPIDPTYPEDRISYILVNSDSKIILKDVDKVLANYIFKDVDDDLSDKYNDEDIVYIIYTSGSTGKPKGVEITYKTLCNYISNCIEKYNIDKDTIFGFFTSISFDLSITAIFTTLVVGGKIEFFKENIDAISLKNIFENSQMNSVKMTPTHLEIMSKYNIEKDRFKLVIVGGEQLKVSTAKRAQEILGKDCKIINEYGPTEATVGCIYHIYDDKREYKNEGLPIGSPLDNIDILMDVDMDTRIGELFIGGNCLAKGYLGNMEETKKKFINIENERFYKSGDICRIIENDELEFLERKDFQVKIRGYRIELEEIEKIIESFESIEGCRVIPNDGKTGIMAYYIGKNIKLNELLKFLETRLPNYMLPYSFIEIESFPLNSNGKLDLKALKMINKKDKEISINLSDFEKKILEIFKEILEIDIPEESLYLNFYELGADSLSIVRLINSIEDMVEKDGIEEIILNPTLENIKKYEKK